jgi:zinc protease
VSNIREDKGYTYTPGSSLTTLRQAATLRTRADVRNAVTGASFNEILYELNRMATTSPTEEELNRAKRFLLGIEAIELQSRSSAAGEFAALWLRGLGPDGLPEYIRKVDAIKIEDVDAAARKYFIASRMAIVAVGDEKVIRKELAPFSLPIHELK